MAPLLERERQKESESSQPIIHLSFDLVAEHFLDLQGIFPFPVDMRSPSRPTQEPYLYHALPTECSW